jgi:hypothetical protein
VSYLLESVPIRNPHEFDESNSTQYAQHRTLDGSIGRDYFGDNKRIWRLNYNSTKKTDYDTIKALYDSYLSSGTALTWEITETNYTISETNVHVDLQSRGFSIKGEDYISDFTLVLTEA